jgi:hypothetical protein
MYNVEIAIEVLQAEINIVYLAPAILGHINRLHRDQVYSDSLAVWEVASSFHYPTSTSTTQVENGFGFPRGIIHNLSHGWRICADYLLKHVMLLVKSFELLIIRRELINIRVVVYAPPVFVTIRSCSYRACD